MRKCKFFTLIEVMVAALLLALAGAALISLLLFHNRFSDLLDRRRLVSQLATSRMEQLSQFDFNDLSFAEETDVSVNDDGIPTPDGAYLRTTQFSSDGSGGIVMTVRVVSPGDSLRKEAEFELVSFRAD